ncbi:transcriptional regulator [Portibacter lacus]|uniref:Transcriptional regulator n=2 Tax=Portibacter lacus TaxID=1099794 RepID=A0AA37SMV3_9BACT|nr:transcriptional regulator [Portibacter lacus]
MLQSKKILTSSEIAKKFDISKRTAYRDIKALEASGIPIYTVEGKGYSLVDGFNVPPVMFTEEEANALITAHHIILQNRDKSLVKNHSSAIEKLKTTLKSAGKEKVELLSQRVAYMKNFKRENSSDSLSDIQKAITDLKIIKIDYVNAAGVSSSREIEPQALYHTQENWILIAWCRKRNAFREFRLDRIQKLVVLNQKFDDRSFLLLDYFAELIELAKKHS